MTRLQLLLVLPFTSAENIASSKLSYQQYGHGIDDRSHHPVNQALRGQNIGRDLVRAIEDEARKRGASRAILFTYSFQAEAFYLRMGYKTFAEFEFPDGPKRIDMKKEL